MTTPQYDELRDKLLVDSEARLSQWRTMARQAPVIARALQTVDTLVQDIKRDALGARLTAERYAGDDTMYPQGRQRLIAESNAKAKATSRNHQVALGVALAALEQTVRVALTPQVPKDREALARDDLRLRLDGAPDPVLAMAEIAKNGGELAAVAASSYGESYLRAKGTTNAPQAASLVRDVAFRSAAEAAVKADDTQLRALGTAALSMDELRDVGTAAVSLASDDLQVASDLGVSMGAGA